MIITIDHLSFSSSSFQNDIDSLKNFGYNVLHQNELLENLQNKKLFLKNFSPTQKFCLLTLDNQISIEILEYDKKFHTKSFMKPHIAISKLSKSKFLNNFDFEVHTNEKNFSNGLNLFQIDLLTNNLVKSEQFWASFGFKKEIQSNSNSLSMNFLSPLSNQTVKLHLILDINQNHYKLLDYIGFNCLAFISTSIQNEKSNLESKNILTSEIQSLQIGQTIFDIFFCKSETGEIVEIIQPKKSIHNF